MHGLTQERLKEVLNYDSATGVFTWRISIGRMKAGSVAGSPDPCGYTKIRFEGNYHSAHRLAWLYVYGAFPSQEIDHINRVRDDNRIANLRNVNHSENLLNREPYQRTSVPVDGKKFAGASQCSHSKNWRAYIKQGKKQVHLGTFPTKEEAHQAYSLALAKAGSAA